MVPIEIRRIPIRFRQHVVTDRHRDLDQIENQKAQSSLIEPPDLIRYSIDSLTDKHQLFLRRFPQFRAGHFSAFRGQCCSTCVTKLTALRKRSTAITASHTFHLPISTIAKHRILCKQYILLFTLFHLLKNEFFLTFLAGTREYLTKNKTRAVLLSETARNDLYFLSSTRL